MLTSSFGTAGGGAYGKVAGIARIITTGTGAIMIRFRVFISMWTQDGEDTTENIAGTGTGGTMIGFPTNGFNKTGRAGIIITIGKSKEPGASRVINLGRRNKGRR
jgi:hypothetical protein